MNYASDKDTNNDKFLSDLTLQVNKRVPSRLIAKRELNLSQNHGSATEFRK